MSDPVRIYNTVFLLAAGFLIIEAVFGIMYNMKKPSKGTTLSQAATWIKSLLMIVFAVIIVTFLQSTDTSVSVPRV